MPSHDARTSLRDAVRLSLFFAAIKLLVQIAGNIAAQHAGYGIFRDELYYIVCGRHLQFGYVDQPPMVALQARLADGLFGHGNLALLRIFAGLAGAAKVFLTGMLTWALGGRRVAQALAMLGVLCAAIYLGIDAFLSMNSFEPVFWMLCVLALIRIVQGADPALWWTVFGVSAGLGLENKHSEIFFLIALLLGIALSPQRRILLSRWVAVAVAIIALLGLPNLLWQIHYHFPTVQWLLNVAHTGKDVKLSPPAFLFGQFAFLNPLNIFIWGTGLIWLLVSKRARNFRFIGLTYLIFLALMMALHGKDYYLSPIYPVLFAAGGCAWEWTPASSPEKKITALILASLIVMTTIFLFPMSVPVLSPPRFVTYMRVTHLHTTETEEHKPGLLPQFYADMIGWQQMADAIAAAYNSLPAQDRARAGIFCGNYGEAGAVDVLARQYGIPNAISGHQTYWFWGPRGYTGDVMVIASQATLDQVREVFSSAQVAAHLENIYSIPYEHINIYIARGRKKAYQQNWNDLKVWH
jgi:hypothetical protein